MHHDSWITTTCRISCLLLWLLMFYNNNYNNVLERTRHWLTSVYGTYLSLLTTCSTFAFIHLMPFKIFPPQRNITPQGDSFHWIHQRDQITNKRIGSSYDSQECFYFTACFLVCHKRSVNKKIKHAIYHLFILWIIFEISNEGNWIIRN